MVASVDEGGWFAGEEYSSRRVDGNDLEVIRERWRRSVEYRREDAAGGTDKVEGKDEW